MSLCPRPVGGMGGLRQYQLFPEISVLNEIRFERATPNSSADSKYLMKEILNTSLIIIILYLSRIIQIDSNMFICSLEKKSCFAYLPNSTGMHITVNFIYFEAFFKYDIL